MTPHTRDPLLVLRQFDLLPEIWKRANISNTYEVYHTGVRAQLAQPTTSRMQPPVPEQACLLCAPPSCMPKHAPPAATLSAQEREPNGRLTAASKEGVGTAVPSNSTQQPDAATMLLLAARAGPRRRHTAG